MAVEQRRFGQCATSCYLPAVVVVTAAVMMQSLLLRVAGAVEEWRLTSQSALTPKRVEASETERARFRFHSIVHSLQLPAELKRMRRARWPGVIARALQFVVG